MKRSPPTLWTKKISERLGKTFSSPHSQLKSFNWYKSDSLRYIKDIKDSLNLKTKLSGDNIKPPTVRAGLKDIRAVSGREAGEVRQLGGQQVGLLEVAGGPGGRGLNQGKSGLLEKLPAHAASRKC